ncbi:MAG: response regulator, partial [Euryarchaeota archaeon]
IEVLQAAKTKGIYIPFIMLTGHGNVETAVEAMKLGAYDFIAKPPDLNRLLTAVRHAIENKTLRKENLKLKRKVAQKYNIVGESEEVIKMKEMIWLVEGQNSKENDAETFIRIFCLSAPRLRRELRQQATFMRGVPRERIEIHAIRSPRLLRCRFTIDR